MSEEGRLLGEDKSSFRHSSSKMEVIHFGGQEPRNVTVRMSLGYRVPFQDLDLTGYISPGSREGT